MYHFIRHNDVLQNCAKFLRKLLFTQIWSFALPAVTSATVVDVLLFLDLCCHCAVVFCASEQPAKRDVVFPHLALVSTSENVLHSRKQVISDDPGMSARV